MRAFLWPIQLILDWFINATHCCVLSFLTTCFPCMPFCQELAASAAIHAHKTAVPGDGQSAYNVATQTFTSIPDNV